MTAKTRGAPLPTPTTQSLSGTSMRTKTAAWETKRKMARLVTHFIIIIGVVASTFVQECKNETRYREVADHPRTTSATNRMS